MASLKIIGSTETVDLPELGLSKVPAKIDTGAKTSVLHCKDFRVEKEGAKRYIYFRLQDDDKEYRFIVHREKKVKSSFGESEIRYILDRKSTRLNSSHVSISYAVFCLKKTSHTRCR